MELEIRDLLNAQGYVEFHCPSWCEIRQELVDAMISPFKGKIERLEDLHTVLDISEVNNYRLREIAKINSSQDSIERVIEPFWPFIESVIGFDCLRQKRINLVVHLPGDESSVIPIHSDVKTGNSSFELGLWIPLTECLAENSMLIMPLDKWKKNERKFKHRIDENFLPFLSEGSNAFFFKHFLPHGNEVNRSSQTRVSLNIRFKGLFSPENKKTALDYYTPWKISEFTRQAMNEWEE